MSAFHSSGLWLAVITMAPQVSARVAQRNCRVGVGVMPASMGRQPTAINPAQTASETMGPEVRVSRPIRTLPGPT